MEAGRPRGNPAGEGTARGKGIKPVFKLVDTCAAEFESMTPTSIRLTTKRTKHLRPRRPRSSFWARGEPHWPGHRVRLLLLPCGFRAERRWVRDHHGQLQSGDGFDRLRHRDRLYFEPLTLEDVLAVYNHEAQSGAEIGMIVQFGGQTPLNLAKRLLAAGVPIIGTSPESIDLAGPQALRQAAGGVGDSAACRRHGHQRGRSVGGGQAYRLSGAGASQLCSGRPAMVIAMTPRRWPST